MRGYIDTSNGNQNLDPSCLSSLKSFKVKKNLGSELAFLGNFTKDGYIARFVDGDECESGT